MRGEKEQNQLHQRKRKVFQEEYHGQLYQRQQTGQVEQGRKVCVCRLQATDHFVCEEGRFRWNEIFCKQTDKDKWTERIGGVR